MKLVHFDCFAGISGDMTVAALLDAGVPASELESELRKLPLPHSSWSISAGRTARHGISASTFTVSVGEHQPHRHYRDIAGMIEASALEEGVKEKAQKIFYVLAEAEARVHGVDIERVHFHEVGAIDSIIDIVGAAVCLDRLGNPSVSCSPIPLGSGWVETAHGRLPVPAPATALLLQGMPVVPGPGPGERVTPTGAAILAALATRKGEMPPMNVTAVGCGAGEKDFPDVPNVLRVFVGEDGETPAELMVVETNLDDMPAEPLGFLMERLLAEGALDVFFTSIQMKKNRPGTLLTLLSPMHLLQRLSRIVLAESTAIGVRYYPVKRFTLQRSVETRQTSLGTVRVKLVSDESRLLRISPEYEDCARISRDTGIPILQVYRTVEREAGA